MSEQEQFSTLALESGTFETRLTKKFEKRTLFVKQDPRVLKAAIPGAIERIDTPPGSKVNAGDTLLILEAMKMHNRIKAPMAGTVKAVYVAAGEKVVKGQILIELE